LQTQNPIYSIDTLALYALIGTSLFAVCASVVAAIAFGRDEKSSARYFAGFAEQAGALRIITVGMIVLAATFLALANKITGEAVVAIISGVAGYVLGGFQHRKDKKQDDEKP
jgi:hypothetical protein